MTTVIDHARPWLIPSSTLAATTHAQLGAAAISSGYGQRNGPPGDQQPPAPDALRECPAPKFVNAFESPKATMNDSTAAFEARWKSVASD